MTAAAPPVTVLVTGGRGRLGRLLVDDLRADGVRTISLGRSASGVGHADDVVVDLRDADAVAQVVGRSEPDVVVHLASVLRGPDLAEQNHLIDLAVAAGVRAAGASRVVLSSSCAVYGTSTREALDEDSPLAGDGEYARSKARAEEIFRELSDADAGVGVTALRIFNIAGPDFPESLVQRLLSATEQEPVPVIEPDRFVRDYIHQQDVVAAMRAAIEHPAAGFRVVNVGAGEAVSTRMLLERLEVEGSRIVIRAGEPSCNWADISRLKAELGVVPRAVPTPAWALAGGDRLSREGRADGRMV